MKSSRFTKIMAVALTVLMLTGLLPMTAMAATPNQLKTTIEAHDSRLTATVDGNTVTVTGSAPGAGRLTLNIDPDVTVVWKAEISSYQGNNWQWLRVEGGGTFEVAEGGIIDVSGEGRAIHIEANTTVNVTGGTVKADTNNAIIIWGSNSSVAVSDGTVENTGSSPCIDSTGSNSTITVSGGTVRNTGSGIAIRPGTSSTVNITGGTVSANTNSAIYLIHDTNLTVSGGEITSAAVNIGTIQVDFNGLALIRGGAVRSRSGSYGIRSVTGNGVVYRDGGIIDAVVPIGGGLFIIKAGAENVYTQGSNNDLTVNPSSATAFWDNKDGLSGISYTNAANTGFFEVPGVMVNTSQPDGLRISGDPILYTNMTAFGSALTAALGRDDTVTVSGRLTVNDGVGQIGFGNLTESKRVIWEADYTCNVNVFALIGFGRGTFELASGSIILNGSGMALYMNGANASVVISGGTLSAVGTAIGNNALGNTLTINGGTVTCTGTAIHMVEAVITINDGTVQSTGDGWGIIANTNTSVYINGGKVIANIREAVTGAQNITISGGYISSANVFNGGGTIAAHNANFTGGTVENTATNGYAFASAVNNGRIYVNGGTIKLARTDGVKYIMSGMHNSIAIEVAPTTTGNVYTAGTSVDLIIAPTTGASATWAVDNEKHGIAYARTTNTGFIEVPGVLVNPVPLSDDAKLSALTVSSGTLTPAFDQEIANYSVTVANSVDSITITATANDAKASVSGAGEKALAVGANGFDIVVTAEDSTTKTYTVNVTREAPSILNPNSLYFNTEDGQFHFDSFTGIVYTGQADRWSWDSGSYTLTLNGFHWNVGGGPALTLSSYMTIRLEGDNSISCVGGTALSSNAGGIDICGPGTLNVRGAEPGFGWGYGVVAETLTIYGGATVDIFGHQYGLNRGRVVEGTLIIRSSNFAIWNGIEVTAPEYTYWLNTIDPDDPGTVYTGNNPFPSGYGWNYVKITTAAAEQEIHPYGLVFDVNDGKFYSDTSPSRLYTKQADRWGWDETSRTLTLNDFEWYSAYNRVLTITNGDPITLELQGVNIFGTAFSNRGIVGVSLNARVTTTGDGSLTIYNDTQNGIAIYSPHNLVIDGGLVTIWSNYYTLNNSWELNTPAYTWWTNTVASDPGGPGTRYPDQAPYIHHDTQKFIKIDAREVGPPIPVLTGIAVTTPPTKTVYIVGEALDLEGMVVTATYSDDSTKAVTGYITHIPNGGILNTIATFPVTVFYIEGDRNVNTSFFITVHDPSLTYSATIDPHTSHTFYSAIVGYGEQSSQVFTVTNTGTGTINSLNAGLTSATYFEYSTPWSGIPVRPGGTGTISIRPKTGLAVGYYTETLTVIVNNEINLVVKLNFEVKAAVCAHIEDGGTVTTPATCEADGVRMFKCTICSDTLRTAPIPKLAHDFSVRVEHKTPTAEEDGYDIFKCSRCNETRTIVVPKTGAKTIVSVATASRDFVSIAETAKNSRVWVLTFNVTLTYADGTKETVRFSVNLNGNNANQSGKYVFADDHVLAGYTIVYDIKGNGSNIKDLRVVKN